MTKIYLLDPRSEIFQSFITPQQLYGFAQRSTRNFRARSNQPRLHRRGFFIDCEVFKL
jgi:hypothetical protein